MKNLLLVTTLALVLGGCAGRRVINNFQGDSSARVADVITIRTGWLKNKNNSYDTELWFSNDSKVPLVLPVGRMSCQRENNNGSMRFLSYYTNMLELEPGEQRRLIVVCDLSAPGNGPWTFTFRDIAQRAPNGGTGKVFANQLTLKLNEAPEGT